MIFWVSGQNDYYYYFFFAFFLLCFKRPFHVLLINCSFLRYFFVNFLSIATFLDSILWFSCLFNILINILLTCCSFVIDAYVNVWYVHNVFRFVWDFVVFRVLGGISTLLLLLLRWRWGRWKLWWWWWWWCISLFHFVYGFTMIYRILFC